MFYKLTLLPPFSPTFHHFVILIQYYVYGIGQFILPALGWESACATGKKDLYICKKVKKDLDSYALYVVTYGSK